MTKEQLQFFEEPPKKAVILSAQHYLLFMFFCLLSFALGYSYHLLVAPNSRSPEVSNVILDKNAASSTKSYKGKTYTISYPSSWGVVGPTEGPVTGFPEFIRLVSPSGDMFINIGLDGDNSFEYVSTEHLKNIRNVPVVIGGVEYVGEEKELSFSEDSFDVITLDITLDEKRTLSSNETPVVRPFVVQLYYRFPKAINLDPDNAKSLYEEEKTAALEVLDSFSFVN